MNKTDLSRFRNPDYDPGGTALKRLAWYLVNALFFLNPFNPFSSLKVGLLRLFGCVVGQGVNIKPRVNIKYPWKLTIGDYVWIGEKVWIDNLDFVYIGSNACISQGAMLLCGNHNFKKVAFDLMTGKITIEEGCWIGARTTVCPGVTAHSHSVLTVGSIATTDLTAYGIYQGIPAKKIKDRKIE